MKVYPKIPRYDHPVVPEDFFEATDLTLIEKYDGSAFRFTLFDERYAAPKRPRSGSISGSAQNC